MDEQVVGQKPVTRASRLLLTCGPVGGILFAATYLIEGATRPGYDPWQQAISALSLGAGGWVQQANFILSGLLVCCSAVGWRAVLAPGFGATWVPLLRGITGIGLIICGIFSQDPAPGYPPGTEVPATSSMHALIHNIGALMSISALAAICFVMAWRFAKEFRWRGWGIYSVATGVFICAFMMAFGMAMMHHGPAGLFERLATGFETIWGALIVARLWAGTGRISSEGPVSSYVISG